MIVSIDVGASFSSNRYFQEIQVDDERIFTDFDEGNRFAYEYVGKLDNNIHVLLTWDISTGSGVFQNLTFVKFEIQQGYDRDGIKPLKSLIMSVVRIVQTTIRSKSQIKIQGNSVIINKNKSSMQTIIFEPAISLANPASLNCKKLGGKLVKKSDKGGEYSMCHLPDGRVCEEWKLFRKECP